MEKINAVNPEEFKLEQVEETDQENTLEYQEKINLSPEQEEEIIKIIDANLEMIETQRAEDKSEERWEQYENQYWGVVEENPNMLFNTHIFLTLKHGRRLKSRLYQAFFESDPIFSVSPRPADAKKEGGESAEAQEQFLDYELDSEIILKSPMRKAFHQATMHDGGILKLPWERDKEYTRRKVTYKGGPGLAQLEKDCSEINIYEQFPEYVARLEAGEELTLVLTKPEIVYDAPRPYYLDFKDFFIDLKTDGLLGLRKSKFHAERQHYNWYELKEEIEEGRFDENSVISLIVEIDNENKVAFNPNYLTKDYMIFECNLYYDIKGNGKPKRIVVWYSRDKKVILSAIHFPYDHGRPYYIPFWITEERQGWHQPGLCRILQPQNIIANAGTNLLLDNSFYQHTPLLRTSPNTTVAAQMLSKTWRIGDPLVAEKGEVEAFSLRTGSLGELMALLNQNEHMADETSGVGSPYLSGQSDPTDPDAPAKKTTALLRETNINIKDHILCLAPSFQELAYQILQLFAQFRGTAQYKLKKNSVIGNEKLFKNISAEQLRLRTNITPNAYSFSFDKINQKRENLALVQFLSTNPVAQEFLRNMPRLSGILSIS